MINGMKSILLTGGAGYVGAVLTPKLIQKGFYVKIFDLFLFGDVLFKSFQNNPQLELIKGDIRDQALLRKALQSCDIVIHLACISNDPSFELNPDLGRSINYEAFEPLVELAKESGVKLFVYASSSSVYGVKEEKDVSEDLPLKPLTDYSRYKALCEDILLRKKSSDFATLIIRPATVCGYSPRLRLDLSVNILTNHAFNKRKMRVFGGSQMRPNIHVEDMSDLYLFLLDCPLEKINGKIFNSGYENHSISQIAKIVQQVIGKDVAIEAVPSEDLRSYHISSRRIREELGFIPKYTIEDAVKSLLRAFQEGKIPNAMHDKRYYNIKTMQSLNLK